MITCMHKCRIVSRSGTNIACPHPYKSPINKEKQMLWSLLLASAISASHLVHKGHCPPRDCCERSTISSWNFDTQCPTFDGTAPTWFYYGPFIADDGTFVCSPNGGNLTSNPFTTAVLDTITPAYDHSKWLAFDSVPKNVTAGGRLVLEWNMSSEVFGLGASPFPPQVLQGENDVRLASGAAVAMDMSNSLSFAFHLTNDRVYVLYERQPFTRDIHGNYDVFAYMIPVKKRRPSDFHRLQLTIDDEKKEVVYSVDKKVVLTVSQLGLRLPSPHTPVFDMGGTPALVFPSSVNIGFGTFTLLDFYPASTNVKRKGSPCDYPVIREALANAADTTAPPIYNPILGAPILTSYWDSISTNLPHHVWTQGAKIHIKNMSATSVLCNYD